MAINLYDLSVANYLQTLGAVAGFLKKGAEHAQKNGQNPDALTEVRLHPDMLPFKFQIISVCHHSKGAIEGCKAGQFGPPGASGEPSYAALQAMVDDAAASLKALTPAEVNGLEGKDMIFALGSFKIPFTAENFILSFSLPNFYFHSTTAYAILRMSGVPLGKRDFLGNMRMKS